MRVVPPPTDHVVVVGAGLAGLSAALHLLGAGHRVTILERERHPGGRAGRLDLPTAAGTFQVDPGPTVLTMPEVIAETLGAVGEDLRDRLDLVRLEPAYHARFADGSSIAVHTDPEAMEQEIRRVCGPDSAAGYRRLRAWLTRLYQVEIDTFIGRNFDSVFDLLGRDLVRLVALGGFGRLGPRVARFLPDERLRRLFTFQSLYAGVTPRQALAAYGVISYMDTVAGVYFPRGGMRQLGRALADAAAAAGATIHYGRRVIGLERRGGRVTAVRHVSAEDESGSDRLACDAVVLTPDLPIVADLVGRPPRRPAPLRYAPSAVVVHLGVRRTRTTPAHHTVSFGRAWEQTFDEITHGRLMSDPSLLISRPTATDPGLAPPGHDLVTVIAPCPNTLTGTIDWPRVGPAYRDELLMVLERRGLGLAEPDDIVVSDLVTPADWAAGGYAAGSPFSLAHTVAQTGPFRPGNLVPGLANAVLAGCGTVPGVGIPPVLISGRLAAARITGHHGPGRSTSRRKGGYLRGVDSGHASMSAP